ncbi:MAG: TonB-dependent receptor, partial [Pseudohongiellaceae bacterium]
KPGNFEIATDSYQRWDAGIDYTFTPGDGEVMLFARARNISDEEIRLSTSYLRGFAPETGRSIEVGARFKF